MAHRVAHKQLSRKGIAPRTPDPVENPGVPPEYVLLARDRFCGWLQWFMATRSEVAPTKAALARKLGIGKPALNRLLAHGSRIVPDLKTVLSAEQLTGIPVSALLHSDPPPMPHP